MTEVLDLLLEEEAFFQLQLDSCLLEQAQDVVQVVKVFLMVLREDDDIIKIDKTEAPTDSGQGDVNDALERGWGIPQTEGHAQIAMRAHVTREGGLVTVFLSQEDLPVSPQGVEQGEDAGGAQAVDAVVHAREWVGVRDREGIQAPEVDAEPVCTVLLRRQKHWTRPLRRRWFDDTSLELVLNLCPDLLALVRACAVRCLVNWSSSWLQLDVMLGDFDGPKLAREHGFVLLQDGPDAPLERFRRDVVKLDFRPPIGVSPLLRLRRRPRRVCSVRRLEREILHRLR